MAIVAGQGTHLQLETSPSTFTTIAQVITISGPNRAVASVEVTTLDSTERTFRPGLLDNGELSFTIQYDPDATTHTALTALLATPAVKNWKLVLTDTTPSTYALSAFLTAFNPGGMETDGNLTAECTLKVNTITIT
jgi:hypothetical protein